MQYRKLGNTGFDVSVIGFGTWQIGGGRWSSQSDARSIELLQKSNDLGVNIFDVAVVYGQYSDEQGYLQSRSQELLGEAFSDRRDRVIYNLKLGQYEEYSHRHNYAPERLVEQFQHSLRRLKTDYIDICMIHAPSIEVVQDARAIAVLKTLQALGLVKAIGYSFESEPKHVEAALEQDIDVIMLQHNLIDRACNDMISLAEQHGVGILVGGPYKRGYLTGRYKTVADFSLEDDYWRWNLRYNKGKVEDILSQVNALLKQHGSAEVLKKAALAYILKKSNVASCVIGHRNIEEVLDNIKLVSEA